MKSMISKKILVYFRDPKKFPRLSIDPKNPFRLKFQTPKNPTNPPSVKYVSWAPGSGLFRPHDFRMPKGLESPLLLSGMSGNSFLNLQMDPFSLQTLSC